MRWISRGSSAGADHHAEAAGRVVALPGEPVLAAAVVDHDETAALVRHPHVLHVAARIAAGRAGLRAQHGRRQP